MPKTFDQALDEAKWVDLPWQLIFAMLLSGSIVWALAAYGLVKLISG